MGYRSDVYLKTTTEGYIVLKMLNDSIDNPEHRPFEYAEIQKTASGFYKIKFEDIKWYEESYPEIKNFMNGLDRLCDQNIPYSFIRIGEDVTDIEHKVNWTDDMPNEIETFEPVVDVNDEDWSVYEEVMPDGKEVKSKLVIEPIDDITKADEKMRPIMFELFDTYKYSEDMMLQLQLLLKNKEITEQEYNRADEKYNDWLADWEEDRI